MANKLTDEQIESIKNYEKDIKTLEDFVTAVRKLPGMYIGHIGNKGFINMFREIFQNAIDEVMRVYSPCNSIRIIFDERTCAVTVEDNGRGIPFGTMIRVFADQHTSSNYTKKKGEYTSGLHGSGSKITNALSSVFIVESYILGDARRLEFTDGKPWKKGEVKIPNKENKQGTKVYFEPSFDIMGHITVTANDILTLIQMLNPLTPIGTKFYYTAIFNDGKKQDVVIENKDGIMCYLYDICKKPLIKPINFSADNGDFRANVVICYDLPDENTQSAEIIVPFSNFCPTESVRSSHVIGCINGIRKYFVNYMNKVYLNSIQNNGKKKKKNITITESDIKSGLRVIIDAACLEPLFTGQAKEVLSVDGMKSFIEELTIRSLEEWGKANPQALQKLCKYFKDLAELRTDTDTKKIKLSNQYASTTAGLPSKYMKPTKKKKEFFIVEGDSAKGSFDTYRDNETQGVFPIRGMILNCFEKPESKCLQNAEVAGILAIIGGGYGKNFNIDKVQWEKVIACADADAAGSEIVALLLRLVLRFCPQLILAGKYYKAIPPLYYIGKGKNKTYFTNRVELVEYIQREFSKTNKITTMKDKVLSASAVQELLYQNIDYIYELEKVANRYRINPVILEMYLYNRNKSPEEICKIIKKSYRFMEKTVINGHLVCEGIADGISNTIILDGKLLKDCKNIIDIMEGNLYDKYKVNGQECTILDIMSLYNNYKPSSITRLKGLGEQDGSELAESVILPGDKGNRTLLQYTMDSAMKEIEQIRKFESDKSKLLEGLVVNRIDVAD